MTDSIQHTPGPWIALKGIVESDSMRCGVAADRGARQYLVETVENGAPGDICDTATTHVQALIAYGAAIQKELGASDDGIENLVAAYRASLEKPVWPPQVEKTPLYLKGQEPPPQSPHQSK